MRQIVFDTETTGLSPQAGHRITEIGCLELIDRKVTGKTFHTYLNPEREVDEESIKITGLTNEFLQDKPRFVEVVDDFLAFIQGAELIIHNAPFDVGFVNHELRLIEHDCQDIANISSILDTLVMARKKYPGQRNSLDALCKRLDVDNSNRKFHGALLDAEILAEVYIAMTSGQTTLNFLSENSSNSKNSKAKTVLSKSNVAINSQLNLKVIKANIDELKEHSKVLELLNSKSENGAVWGSVLAENNIPTEG